MNSYFWIVLIILFILYLYINRNKKQKQAYFQATMISLQTKGITSNQLLEKLTSAESGKILIRCFNEKKSPDEAANMLIALYSKRI